MIRFLSEDSQDSPFVTLFNKAYGGTAFLEGVGSNIELKRRARKYAKRGDQVVIYFDMVPDNPSLFGLYQSLLELYTVSELDVVILPIVCAEFLFIRSVVGVEGTIVDSTDLLSILSKSMDYNSLAVTKLPGVREKQFSSFEKVCKLFCARCFKEGCCAVSDGYTRVSSERKYFADDCKCVDCVTRFTLSEKAILYRDQLGVVPYVPGAVGIYQLSWADVIDLGRKLVDEYNIWAKASGYSVQMLKAR